MIKTGGKIVPATCHTPLFQVSFVPTDSMVVLFTILSILLDMGSYHIPKSVNAETNQCEQEYRFQNGVYLYHVACPPLRQEIIIGNSCKVILCTRLATKRLAISDFLQVVQSTGNALIAVGVKGIEVNGSPPIYSAIDFAAVDNMVTVSIYEARSRCTIGVDEVTVCVGGIARSFQVTVTKGILDD